MKEYLVTAFVLTLIAGVCTALSHDGYKKASATAVGVIVISTLIVPLTSLGEGVKDFIQGTDNIPEGSVGNGYFEVAEEAFCQGIAEAVSKKFGVKSEHISVRSEGFLAEEMRAERITVLLTGSAVISDITSIRKFIEESFVSDGGVCRVEIEV